MKIATWNINSVRLRIAQVARFLTEHQPDVLCLQETKSPDEHFPAEAFEQVGYTHRVVHGMKSYNGVAIVSRLPFVADVKASRYDWCGKEDCRHAVAHFQNGIELHDIYIPAGGDIPDPIANEKFAHKLQFLDELTAWFGATDPSAPRILVGDLNIAPLEHDVWSHKQLLTVVSHTPIEVEKLEALRRAGGFTDAVRHFVPPDQKLYSWWSYRNRDWSVSDRGRRLDHIWVTEPLKSRLVSTETARAARGWEQASDHVPVMVTLDL